MSAQPGQQAPMQSAQQPMLNKPVGSTSQSTTPFTADHLSAILQASPPQEEDIPKHICDPIKDCWFFGFFRAVGSILCLDRLFPE